MDSTATIQLTKTVTKGGCAAKVAAQTLREILAGVIFPPSHPALLVDGSSFDDAAIYRVTDEIALVQTLDFFTPVVNDPRTFGRVAATNALSDVYAMGGEPATCLAILAFPLAKFPNEIVQAVMQGAADVIAESGAVLAGGHSIDDESLKFGLSVTGFVHPERFWSNAGAEPGDRLILTKPLGTGTLLAGLKSDAYSEQELGSLLRSMTTLNRVRPLLDDRLDRAVRAATDVTGFGLAGHALHIAEASGVSLRISPSKIPVFEQVRESLTAGRLTKAHSTNRDYVQHRIRFRGATPTDELVVFDPQTSGGLLLSVDPAEADTVLERLRTSFSDAAIVGEVLPRGEELILFEG